MNPLLAVQFTKDEYGDKVVKPFVNFHVTPNRNIVQKLGHLLSHKKQTLFENYGANYAPHYYPPKPVQFHQEKPYYVKPQRPLYHYESPYPNEYSDYHRDGDDDYDYDYDGYYRDNARSSGRTPAADANERTVPKERTDGKVSFPNRRKRDVESARLQLSKGITEVSIGAHDHRPRSNVGNEGEGNCAYCTIAFLYKYNSIVINLVSRQCFEEVLNFVFDRDNI